MPFATERDKVGVIQAGLSHPFWTEYLLPLLQERAKNSLNALAMKAAPDDDMKRGRFQAYQDIINAPGREVLAFNEAEATVQAEHAEKSTEEYRAEYGHLSPIRQAPDVGNLKQEDNEAENTA